MTITVTARASVPSDASTHLSIVSGSFTPSASSRVVIVGFAQPNSGDPGTLIDPDIETSITGWTTPPARTFLTNNVSMGFRPHLAVFEGVMGASPAEGDMTVIWDLGWDCYGAFQVFDLTGTIAIPTHKQTAATKVEQDTGGNSETHATNSLGAAATTGNTAIVAFTANADNAGACATPSGWTAVGTPQSAVVITVGIFKRTDFTGTSETCTDLGQVVGCSGSVLFEFEEVGGGESEGPIFLQPVQSALRLM